MELKNRKSQLKNKYSTTNHSPYGECLNRRLRLVCCGKSQLKIQQMAFMLMAVFIFFVLAGMFYILAQSTDFKKQAEISARDRAVKLADTLASSPELTCGSYCVDADRAMVLVNNAEYKSFWQIASLKIRILKNESIDKICTESNYPDCNMIQIYRTDSGETTVDSFVSVCSRVKEGEYVYYKCELGKLIVGYA